LSQIRILQHWKSIFKLVRQANHSSIKLRWNTRIVFSQSVFINARGKTQGIAIQVLGEARKRRAAAGKDPMGLAAAALYIACLQDNEKKTQKDIADAASVTEVTVRNRYKTLKRQLKLEVPD
jgi:transcription initiation factor TFIIIB Brf1 subunit/transcription initiation factor TFIIB